MSNLASRPTGAKPGDGEGTHFAREGFPQPDGVKRLDFSRDGFAQTPWFLIKKGCTSKQLEVFFEVDRMCRAEGRTYCIPGTRIFEKTIGMKEGTARKALKALAKKEVIFTEDVIINGVPREVIHCPWLFKDDWAGAVIEFGHGVGFDVDQGKTVRTGKPDRRPTIPFRDPVPEGAKCAPEHAKCAPEGAPRSAPKQREFPEEEKSKARDLCVAAFALGGDREQKAPDPIPTAPAGPDPGEVASAIATFEAEKPADRNLAKFHESTRRKAAHFLARAGLVPAHLAEACAAYGEPDPPEAPRPRAIVESPPRSAKDLIFRVADPTGPEAKAEVLARLAQDLKAKPTSLAKKVDAAAAGRIPPAILWEGYQQAMSPGARAPGAVFNSTVNRMMGAPK